MEHRGMLILRQITLMLYRTSYKCYNDSDIVNVAHKKTMLLNLLKLLKQKAIILAHLAFRSHAYSMIYPQLRKNKDNSQRY